MGEMLTTKSMMSKYTK